MKKVLALLVTLGLALSLNANAINIELTTDKNALTLSDTLAIDVRISGLNHGSSPSLGAYDLDFNYDPNLFAIHSIMWGDATQGNQLDLMNYDSLQDSSSGNGWLNLFELSFDSAADLNLLQAGEFILFSVLLHTITNGSGIFSLTANSVSDAYGEELFIAPINNLSVVVNSVSVPEPSSMLLLLGMIAFIALRNKLAQSQK
jgi:hypothetical protein